MKQLTYVLLISIITLLFFGGCEKEIDIKIRKEKLSGFVQKGPFINGTSILMAELNSALEQTGNTFNTQITNNKGSFEFGSVALTSSYVEFSANGYYYDEVKGDISIAPLNLYAITDITDIIMVNVNILTHLEKRRVEYLVKQKKTFVEAKKTAQEEILAIFGFENDEIQESETLDISVNHNDNATLLAISLILQGNRSVGDLTELLADISSDIAEDGIMDNISTITELRNSTLQLDLQNIRQNLVARYQVLGVSATISNFEKYIADFLTHTAVNPSAEVIPATNITTTEATLNGTVNPNSSSTVVTFQYGLTTEYGNSVIASQSPVTGNTNTNVSAGITDLSPGKRYYFRVKAENGLGVTYGADMTFITLGDKPTATSLAASEITNTSARLNGTVNPNYFSTTVTFEYGTTTDYGNTITASQNPVTGNTNTNVSAGISDLSPGTRYYFRVKAENELGVTYGADMTFKTLGEKPSASTLSATDITNTSARLNGTINANYLTTNVTFEYGTTSAYGNSITADQSPLEGNTNINVSAEISGLSLGTDYHFRIKAENKKGTVYGEDFVFKTHITGLKGTVTDSEGSVYNTIGIGSKIWMAENLRYLPNVVGPETGSNTTPYYYVYDYNGTSIIDAKATTNYQTYGVLYNWPAAIQACPSGWHLPTEQEWTSHKNHLMANWSDFAGLLGGLLLYNDMIPFMHREDYGYWWSSTESNNSNSWYFCYLRNYKSNPIISTSVKSYGLSVRCVKD